jgi:hypothetical protein
MKCSDWQVLQNFYQKTGVIRRNRQINNLLKYDYDSVKKAFKIITRGVRENSTKIIIIVVQIAINR